MKAFIDKLLKKPKKKKKGRGTTCRRFEDWEKPLILEALSKNRSPERDRAWFVFGMMTGYRISEALSIHIQDILAPDGSIYDHVTVHASSMKNKRDRRVRINETAQKYLRTWLDVSGKKTGLLFPIVRQSAHRIIKDAARRAGLDARRIGTHSMRKTAGWEVYTKSGNNIRVAQEFLGHSKPDITMVYLEIGSEQVDQVVDMIGIDDLV